MGLTHDMLYRVQIFKPVQILIDGVMYSVKRKIWSGQLGCHGSTWARLLYSLIFTFRAISSMCQCSVLRSSNDNR